MASEPPPGSTDGATRTPPSPSSAAAPRGPYVRQCVVLFDWWLERVEGEEGKIRVAGTDSTAQMRKGAPSSMGNSNVACRVFRSTAITRRHGQHAIETEDCKRIQIRRLLNIPRTRENGFSEEVCKCFEFGFPKQWAKLVNPNLEQQNEQPISESAVEYWVEKFSRGDFSDLAKYDFEENDSCSSAWYTSNADGPAIQSLSNLPDDNAGNMAASGGLYGGRMNMPGTPLARPRETSCSGQESDQHESMKIGTSEQGLDNHSISSVSANQSTGSFCPNSKGDDSILVTSKIMSVEKEGYRRRVGSGQTEEDADIQHENMQIVTLPIDSAIVNENANAASSDLEKLGTPKCGKASLNLGSTDALELPTERMTPQFGAVRGSEGSPVRRLRSGKVFGTPSGGLMKSGHRKRKIQHGASTQNMIPNEGETSTADLTSHENDSSVAGVVTKDKQGSRDSHRGISAMKAKKKRKESRQLFWNWC